GAHRVGRSVCELAASRGAGVDDRFLYDRLDDCFLRNPLSGPRIETRENGVVAHFPRNPMTTTKKQFSTSAYVHKAVHEYRHAPAHRGSEAQRVRVISVEAGSLAERIGLKPGDEIHELNGKPVLDVIDFQFNAANVGRRTTIQTQDRRITFVRREWESFG